MSKLTTEISHKDLMNAWAPLVDVSMTLDTLMKKAGGGKAGEIIGFMDDKVKRALEPLKACIDRIENADPDNFS